MYVKRMKHHFSVWLTRRPSAPPATTVSTMPTSSPGNTSASPSTTPHLNKPPSATSARYWSFLHVYSHCLWWCCVSVDQFTSTGEKGVLVLSARQGDSVQRVWCSHTQGQSAYSEARKISANGSQTLCNCCALLCITVLGGIWFLYFD